jgi:hypothetical protein
VSRRWECPWWCDDHSDSEAASYPHRSRHDHIPLGHSERGFVTAYAAGADADAENDGEPSVVAVTIDAVVHGDPGIDVRLWIRDPDRARDLALLVESLSHATPGQHRVLVAQIRTAAGIVTIAREDALRAEARGGS